MAPSQRSAVIIGASYGLGAELARELASRGYRLGLAARSADKLETLAGELGVHCTTATLDVTDPAEAVPRLEHLFDEMDGAEEIYLNAGVFNFNKYFRIIAHLTGRPDFKIGTYHVNVTGTAKPNTKLNDLIYFFRRDPHGNNAKFFPVVI